MPGAVNPDVTIGFFGKLPARGDFVRAGLPRSFIDPWDAWLQEVLSGSRAILADEWLGAWLEAPVWRFALPGRQCGADAVLGLMLPSVDRVGRYFPLTLAALYRQNVLPAPASIAAWLDLCEDVGRSALERDLSPEAVVDSLAAAPGGSDPAPQAGVWWTEGAPRVPRARLSFPALPDPAAFAAMISAAPAGSAGEAVA